MKLLALCILRKEPAPPLILAAQYDVSNFGFFQRSSIQEFLSFFSSTLTEKTAPGIRQAVQQDTYIGYVYTHPQGLTGVVIADQQYPQRVAFTLLNKILEEFLSQYPRVVWAAPSGSTATQGRASLQGATGSSGKSSDTFSLFGFGSFVSSSGSSQKPPNSSSSSLSLSTVSSGTSGNTTTKPVSAPVTPFPVLKDYLVRYQDPKEADPMMKVQKEIDETKVILHKTIESLLDRGEKLDHLVDKSEKLSAQSKGFYKVARKTNSCCFFQ